MKVLIFVVEDEESIQEILKDALEDAGFAVSSAASGEEAIKMLDAKGEYFRALVTDVNLGPSTTTGWEVAKHSRGLNDQLPVVYITGDSAHEWGSKGVPNSVLLTKPFASAQLVTAVSQLLNIANTPGA
jgi:DNA-binding response OmpR family regulator